MAVITGIVSLDQLTGAEMTKVFEFREAHQHNLTFDMPKLGQSDPGANTVSIGWTTIEGLDLTAELVKELLPKADTPRR